MGHMEPVADRVGAAVKQSLPPAVAMILYPVTATAVGHRSAIDVTEPGPILERETAQPLVLDLRHRLNAEISMKIFSIGVELGAVTPFAVGVHTHFEPAQAARNAYIR